MSCIKDLLAVETKFRKTVDQKCKVCYNVETVASKRCCNCSAKALRKR